MVFGGDFQQTLPVIVHGAREDVVSATLQRSHLWAYIEVLHLRINMRLDRADDNADSFAQWLLSIGHGQTASHTMATDNTITSGNDTNSVQLPAHMLCSTIEDLIQSIYSGISDTESAPSSDFFLHRIILAPRNEEVHALNSLILQRLPGQPHICISADSFSQENSVYDS